MPDAVMSRGDAQLAPLREDIAIEDMILINGRMKDGTSFLIDPSWSRMEERIPKPGPGWEAFPKRMEVELAICGNNGTLLADCASDPTSTILAGRTTATPVHYTYFDEWIGLIDEFVCCIRERTQPKINLRWHRRTIDVMNACYESVEARQPVAV